VRDIVKARISPRPSVCERQASENHDEDVQITRETVKPQAIGSAPWQSPPEMPHGPCATKKPGREADRVLQYSDIFQSPSGNLR
jgi:hypothetical protein